MASGRICIDDVEPLWYTAEELIMYFQLNVMGPVFFELDLVALLLMPQQL
jgi:hypothetical protein